MYQIEEHSFRPGEPCIATARLSSLSDAEIAALKAEYNGKIITAEQMLALYEQKLHELEGTAREATSQQILAWLLDWEEVSEEDIYAIFETTPPEQDVTPIIAIDEEGYLILDYNIYIPIIVGMTYDGYYMDSEAINNSEYVQLNNITLWL